MIILLLCQQNFNPRLPCGRRPSSVKSQCPQSNFNPRLPCGRRPSSASSNTTDISFQSTPPMREATAIIMKGMGLPIISIHASHAGGDRSGSMRFMRSNNFNPRLPCGRRLPADQSPISAAHFNPRLPCGRRLGITKGLLLWRYFNPRLPCGRRRTTWKHPNASSHFNPRLPCGRRRCCGKIQCGWERFQSTPPMREATDRSIAMKYP